MNEENVNIIEILLFNILSTLNTLLVATCDGKKNEENYLKDAQITHDLLCNINYAKQHKTTMKSCFGCKYFNLNHLATMCRCDLNSNYNSHFGCKFHKESEECK